MSIRITGKILPAFDLSNCDGKWGDGDFISGMGLTDAHEELLSHWPVSEDDTRRYFEDLFSSARLDADLIISVDSVARTTRRKDGLWTFDVCVETAPGSDARQGAPFLVGLELERVFKCRHIPNVIEICQPFEDHRLLIQLPGRRRTLTEKEMTPLFQDMENFLGIPLVSENPQ